MTNVRETIALEVEIRRLKDISHFWERECKIAFLKLDHRESQLKEIDPNKEKLEKIRKRVNEKADSISYSCEENGEIHFAEIIKELIGDKE